MKLVFIFGDGAVGKMTVGQELAKITDLRLFHNHMTIEPVLAVFGRYDSATVARLRRVMFEEFAKTDAYGMIFTYMLAFDQPDDVAYIEQVKELFRPYGTSFFHVELFAPAEVRLARNATENRLREKRSKRDVALSNKRLLDEDAKYRLHSLPGEITWENYLKIDNTDTPPEEVARIIKETFCL